MYACAKMKRVTDQLDDRVKARITGRDRFDSDYGSSGSDHSGGAAANDVSSSFDELFFDFSICYGGEPTSLAESGAGSDSECDSSIRDSCYKNVDLIERILFDRSDEFKNVLRDQVLKALRVFTWLKSDEQMLRRNVMVYLRDRGYNAAICKTRWEKSGGITAGSYEFIDVVRKDGDDRSFSSGAARYFVDLDFASEFEIARPTNSYERLLQHFPAVFVGTTDELKQILKAVSDAARISLRSRGLHLPPWRKHRFMQNKWFGSYRRTTNLFPTSFSSAASKSHTVKCCAVGFDNAVNAGRLPLASATHTR